MNIVHLKTFASLFSLLASSQELTKRLRGNIEILGIFQGGQPALEVKASRVEDGCFITRTWHIFCQLGSDKLVVGTNILTETQVIELLEKEVPDFLSKSFLVGKTIYVVENKKYGNPDYFSSAEAALKHANEAFDIQPPLTEWSTELEEYTQNSAEWRYRVSLSSKTID